MAKQKAQKQQPQQMTPMDRLGLRVAAMINSPKAQLDRCVTIHRLDTDPDEAWEGLLELLAEQDGLEMTFNDDGTVTLKWALPGDEDRGAEEGDLVRVAEPAPF